MGKECTVNAREGFAPKQKFSLDTLAVVKKVSPQRIRREEFKFIDKYRTASLGPNRYKS